ncbi:MAG: NAD(P)H-hydrate epimerase [Candidatus Aenigmarchaeota archaeon]|nr:NAD(P)H-hydrate epimerase [Candidatus Aenigmarchaeota archaeon]
MISVNDARDIEKSAQEKGITTLQLMENAGANTAKIINDKIPLKDKNLIVFCGTGNNGGDGFVFARHAKILGAKVSVFLAKKSSEIRTVDAKINFKILKNYQFDIYEKELPEEQLKKADIIVDALLGFGIKGKVTEPYATTIQKINNSKSFTISVDIPSGIDADTGEVLGISVKPNMTITLHDMKKGMKKENSEEIRVVDIGIPKGFL